MPSEIRDLIDRVTSALGSEATPDRVERVARAVLDARSPTGSGGASRVVALAEGIRPAPGATRVVVTAYGLDRPGVLAGITAELSAAGANVLDVSQKVLQGYFTVVLVADLPDADLAATRDALQRRGESLGARVLLQHEELFQAMHRP
ncbi:MAG: ACT domain-containing protein [Bacteroidota bacterium]